MPLVSPDCYRSVFLPFAGARACLQTAIGNVGDDLIACALYQLLAYYSVRLTQPAEADVFLWNGGGNLGTMYEGERLLRQRHLSLAERFDKPFIVLPQSHTSGPPDPELNTDRCTLWARETWTQSLYRRARLAPDLALAFSPPWPTVPIREPYGLFLRRDAERGIEGGSDPAQIIPRNVRAYWELASSFETVETNRLHFAILARLAGRRVILHPNKTPKLRAMWETWLRDRGFEWSRTPPNLSHVQFARQAPVR